jgi:hypothetical protein
VKRKKEIRQKTKDTRPKAEDRGMKKKAGADLIPLLGGVRGGFLKTEDRRRRRGGGENGMGRYNKEDKRRKKED